MRRNKVIASLIPEEPRDFRRLFLFSWLCGPCKLLGEGRERVGRGVGHDGVEDGGGEGEAN